MISANQIDYIRLEYINYDSILVSYVATILVVYKWMLWHAYQTTHFMNAFYKKKQKNPKKTHTHKHPPPQFIYVTYTVHISKTHRYYQYNIQCTLYTVPAMYPWMKLGELMSVYFILLLYVFNLKVCDRIVSTSGRVWCPNLY